MIELGFIIICGTAAWIYYGSRNPIHHYSEKQEVELARVKIHDSDIRCIREVNRANPLRRK